MSAIASHPKVAIRQAQVLYSLTSPIVGTSFDATRYPKVEQALKERCEDFSDVANETSAGDLEAKSESNETELKNPKLYLAAEIARKAIILSAFTKEFQNTYEADLEDVTETGNLLARLRILVGCPSETETREAFRKRLNALKRRADEPYTNFLRRLTDLAKKLGRDENYAKALAEDKFSESLNAKEKEFALIHLTAAKTPANIARLLDDKEQYKTTASIAMVSQQSVSLDAKMDAFTDLMQQMLMEQRESQTQFQKCIGEKLAAVENDSRSIHQRMGESHIRLNAVNTVGKNGQITKWEPQFEWQKTWKLNKYGRPVTCHECGLRGHLQAECRGTRRICETCGRQGHTKFANNHHAKNESRAQMNRL